MKLSARNQIPARVTGIHSGEAIANVELDANGVRLVASITVEAVRQLGLKEGSEVSAVIKASDVMVGSERLTMPGAGGPGHAAPPAAGFDARVGSSAADDGAGAGEGGGQGQAGRQLIRRALHRDGDLSGRARGCPRPARK